MLTSLPPSPDDTIVLQPGQPIIDANGNAWSIIGGRVAVNGVVDPTTSRVIELAYENGQVWQRNADHLWWRKTAPGDSWWPPFGTAVSPAAPVARSWIGPDGGDFDNPANWTPYGVPGRGDSVSLLSASHQVTIRLDNTFLAAGLRVTTIDEGSPVVLDMGGIVFNAATVRSIFGTLAVNLADGAKLINAGEVGATSSIGNGFLTVTMGAGSRFDNVGTISATATAVPGLLGTVSIDGPGTFVNAGLINATDGRFDLTFDRMSFNAGQIRASGQGEAVINIGTTYGQMSHFTNYGLIEADGNATIDLLALRAFETRYGDVTNAGLIAAKGGHIEIDAPLHQTPIGRITIEDGGSVKLDQASDGGTIQISQGMLEFGGFGRASYGPFGARGFDSTLIFTGSSGQLGFSGIDVTEEFKATSPLTSELLVYLADGSNRLLADIHLAGQYSADQFTASGSVITYAAHPAETAQAVPAMAAMDHFA